ncbi:MAG: adenylyltransferase/cytidyltransferase family protein [Clostridiales Family XIII bacterium]|nr:adenylyltransferase/cytidyltransferase family protein [Clostridiales Family XIII bacterium]
MRVNPFIPDTFCKTIHILGHCSTYGLGVDDTRTVAAQLQRKLNAENESADIRVLNRGQVGMDMGNPMFILNAIEYLNDQKGDILIVIVDVTMDSHRMSGAVERMLNDRRQVYHCLREHFDAKREKPAYVDGWHLSPHGMELTADYIHEILLRDDMLSDEQTLISANNNYVYAEEIIAKAPREGICASADAEATHADTTQEDDAALAHYLQKLSELKPLPGQTAGAIVMNCNPFTKGHRHLIERAAREVGRLYIFVVQEDKSEFPFETRMEMVKAGVRDIENATCLPSGKYVLSAMTFPEYFSKDTIRDVTVDCSLDITIFADKIAPCLNITKRFVGKEPFDPVTRQYNGAMKDILPAHGIEVVEYERFEIDGTAVSASDVRKLLADGRLEEVRRLVPDTTYCLIAGTTATDSSFAHTACPPCTY